MARMVLPSVLLCIITPTILFSMPKESYGGSGNGTNSDQDISFCAAGCRNNQSLRSMCKSVTNGKQFANLT